MTVLHDARDALTYDFARPVTLSREHARLLEVALEAFARQAGTVLSSSLRTVCQVRLLTLEETTYVDYVEQMEEQTLLHVLALEPLAQPGIWQVPVQTAMTWVDVLLGGPGTSTQPLRPLSDIESAVIDGMVRGLLAELCAALDPVVHLTATVSGTSYKPRLAHLVPNATVLVTAAFALRQGEHEAVMTLALPFTSLLPHLEQQTRAGAPNESEQAARTSARQHVRAAMQDVPVEVAVACRPTAIAPHRLASLAVGDVLPLRHPVDAPLDIVSGDSVFARGTPGTRGQSLACLVVAPIAQETP